MNKIQFTTDHPFAQKSVCSICKKEKYNVNEIAFVNVDNGDVVCYECDSKATLDMYKTEISV